MKKKIIVLAIISTILTVLIYALVKTDKLTLMALGDDLAVGIAPHGEKTTSYNDYISNHLEEQNKLEKYYYQFSEKDLRTTELINNIRNNNTVMINNKKVSIQQALVQADIITLSIGNIDLYNNLNQNYNLSEIELNNYLISIFTDLDELIQLINKYTTGSVVIIGYYNSEFAPMEETVKIYDFIDESYEKIASKNKCEYISVNEEFSGNIKYLPFEGKYNINYKGHEVLSEKIINKLQL